MSSPPSSSAGPVPSNSAPLPPRNMPQNPPTYSIQSVVPPIAQVKVSNPSDVPYRTCFIWRQWTTRSELKRTEIHSSLCWRRIMPEPTNLPLANRPTPTLVIGDIPATQDQRVPALRPPTEQQQEQSADGAPQERPKELPLLQARMIEYHSFDDTPIRQGMYPVSLSIRSYPDGGFRGLELSDPSPNPVIQNFRETVLGYEFHDDLGGYHFYMPVGLIHHRIYRSIADQLDRTYGPTVRLLNRGSDRVHTSFASGKQFEAWNLIWNRLTSAEGLKLAGRMVDKARSITSRLKDDEDEKPRSER